MRFSEFKRNVEGWGSVLGIYDQSTEAHQKAKALEEIGEYLTASSMLDRMDAVGDIAVCIVNAARFQNLFEYEFKLDSFAHSRLGIGMCAKCVINGSYRAAMRALYALCEYNGWKLEDCFYIAWNEIKDRKGIMVDGLYVKWDSMTDQQREEFRQRDMNNTLLRGV